MSEDKINPHTLPRRVSPYEMRVLLILLESDSPLSQYVIHEKSKPSTIPEYLVDESLKTLKAKGFVERKVEIRQSRSRGMKGTYSISTFYLTDPTRIALQEMRR